MSPPPGQTEACALVHDETTVAKVIVAKARGATSGWSRVQVGGGGRIRVSRTGTYDESMCGYPSPSPSVTFAPSSPTAMPTHEPSSMTPSPSSSPSYKPSLTPTPLPSKDVHNCGGYAVAYASADCANWMRPETWSKNAVPVIGSLVEAKPPPLPDTVASSAPACLSVADDGAVASRVVVASRDGRRMRLKVSGKGKVLVKGQVAASDSECNYPTPQPSVSQAPTSPTSPPSFLFTPLPTALPIPNPSRSPFPSVSPTPGPSPGPSVYRHTYACGSAALSDAAISGGGGEIGACSALWTNTSSWLDGQVPSEGGICS